VTVTVTPHCTQQKICLSTTHRKSIWCSAAHKKLGLFQGHSQKGIKATVLPTERWIWYNVTYRRKFGSWATHKRLKLFQSTHKRGFLRKSTHRRAENDWAYIWNKATYHTYIRIFIYIDTTVVYEYMYMCLRLYLCLHQHTSVYAKISPHWSSITKLCSGELPTIPTAQLFEGNFSISFHVRAWCIPNQAKPANWRQAQDVFFENCIVEH